MSWLEASLLGLIQGLTEFLPVSSSGHLVLAERFLGIGEAGPTGILFEVLLHFGTLLSIVVIYHSEIRILNRSFFSAVVRPRTWESAYRDDDSFRTVIHILVTMIPTGIAYILLRKPIEAAFSDPRLAAGMLLVTGMVLLLTLVRGHPSGKITAVKAFFIGLAQSFALFPGISRSGATIATALYQNVEPEKAANFSFLMLLPVVLGATFVKLVAIVGSDITIDWGPMILGTVIAFLSGIVAIRIVLDFVRKGRLQYFAVYCFVVGGLGLWLL